jgi:hypothetical protein
MDMNQNNNIPINNVQEIKNNNGLKILVAFFNCYSNLSCGLYCL